MKLLNQPSSKHARLSSAAREHLRRSYRPGHVRILFVGESPPASGHFFYRADSGLYRALRETFIQAFPDLEVADFLQAFQSMGCYLVDLCGSPVDRLGSAERRQACLDGEPRLAKTLRALRPEIMITVVRSVAENAERAAKKAQWSGLHLQLPYPGRWHHHRVEFAKGLVPLLRREYSAAAIRKFTSESTARRNHN